MGRQLLIRLLQTVVSLIGMSLLIFVLVRASGDPVDLMRTSTSTEDELANIRVQWGLDKSYPEQYWVFLSGLARGDLGSSLIQRRPVTTMIGEALPNSISLSVLAFVIGIGGALVLGVLAATKRDTWLDNGVKFLAILGQALPGFWVAIVAIYIFSVQFRWVPTSGVGGPANYVLPVLTLAFFLMPGMLRLVRSSMLDVLGSEYVKLARIKGLPERTVIWKHALRNALIAPLTAAGAIFAGLITGAVILENVFAWPGVGRLLVTAVSGRDFPVVQGITIMVAVVVLLINLLVDIAYAYVDPRIRFQPMDIAIARPELVVESGATPSGRRWDIFLQLNFCIPAAVLLLLVVAAILAPQVSPYDPLQTSLTQRLQPPAFAGGTWAHVLGTDKLGRDVLTRIIFGARVSLSVSLLVILITGTIGTALGILGGYLGGFVDSLLMRITDISLAFPFILIGFLLAVILGPSVTTVVLAISLLGWAPYARLIRGEVLKLRNADFVLQARVIGSSPLRIMLTHIFPNIVNPLLILATLSVGLIILVESALSYLGAGIPPPTATWGSMVSDGRSLIDTAWWISFFPGLAIGMVVLSGNFLGDWLRDRLDPRLRQI